jgi:glycosyltransferase involved in cell wall biosynthesis
MTAKARALAYDEIPPCQTCPGMFVRAVQHKGHPAMQPRLLGSEDGYNFVGYQESIYVLPQWLGPFTEETRQHQEVIVCDDLTEAQHLLRLKLIGRSSKTPLTSMLGIPVNTHYYGANHPALDPLFIEGYDNIAPDRASALDCNNTTLASLDRALQSFRHRIRKAGVTGATINRFIESREYVSQCMVSSTPGIQFFQGAPLTLGYNPWCMQIEKPTTLFLPFVIPSESWDFDPQGKEKDVCTLIRTLISADTCLGLITNIKATQKAIPLLLGDTSLSSKIYHLPFFLPLPLPRAKKTGQFLFTTSWHQHTDSFYSRGGVDAVKIFAELSRKHPGLELVIRCRIPEDVPEEIRALLNAPNVRILDGKLDAADMSKLFAEAEFYLLPAASLHSMSTLEAMANGCICVLADAWGNDEYLAHGVNGLRIRGREGKYWRYDASRGVVSERYQGLENPDHTFIADAVREIEGLIGAEDRKRLLSDNARSYAASNHNPESIRKQFSSIVTDMKERASYAFDKGKLATT